MDGRDMDGDTSEPSLSGVLLMELPTLGALSLGVEEKEEKDDEGGGSNSRGSRFSDWRKVAMAEARASSSCWGKARFPLPSGTSMSMMRWMQPLVEAK